MKFSWPRLDDEAETPRIPDDLGRGVYRFPNRRFPGAMLVVAPEGRNQAGIGLRVVTETGSAIVADVRRSFDDAVAIAAYLRDATMAEWPITDRRRLESLAGIVLRGGAIPRGRRRRGRLDPVVRSALAGHSEAGNPFDRGRLEAELRTNGNIADTPRDWYVDLADGYVTITKQGTACGVVVSSSGGEYSAGEVDRDVAKAILHILDADRGRRDALGVGRDLLREVVARVPLAHGCDPVLLYRSAADLACVGLWSRFIGPGLDSDAGVAAAVMYDAVDYARARDPGVDIEGLIESVLGVPRSVSREGARLWSSSRGWIELRRTFEGVGFANIAVTGPHGIDCRQVALDGPQAVAAPVAIALVGLPEGSELTYQLRTRAERALRLFIRGRADIADDFGWVTEPLGDSLFEAERSTASLLTRWRHVKPRLEGLA